MSFRFECSNLLWSLALATCGLISLAQAQDDVGSSVLFAPATAQEQEQVAEVSSIQITAHQECLEYLAKESQRRERRACAGELRSA